MNRTLPETARHAAVFWAVAVAALAFIVVVHVAASILLLTFGGILAGTCLRGLAEWSTRRTGLGIGWTMAIELVALGALIVAVVLWSAPHVEQQVEALWTESQRALHDLHTRAGGGPVGKLLSLEPAQLPTWLERHALTAGTFVLDVFGVLGSVLYVVFVAMYFAWAPKLYRRGVLALVPRARRDEASAVCDELGDALRRWMFARLISMAVLGIASSIALWSLGVPLALTLGILAGLLLFVPYLGSIVSAVPAMLIALTVGPWHVLYVAIVYLFIHLLDGYVLTPILFKRALEIPPLLALAAQLVAGALWGILGLAFSTPMVACALVMARHVTAHHRDGG